MMLAVLIVLLASTPVALGAINAGRAKSKAVEPDVKIHGRLAIYNGGCPNFRLWHVGTKHMYSVYGSESDGLGEGDREAEGLTLPANVDRFFDVDNASMSLFSESSSCAHLGNTE